MFENLNKFEGKTLLLYFLIVFSASLLGFFYHKPPFFKKNRFIFFVGSFVVVSFFSMFNCIGFDKDYGYRPIYNMSDSEILSLGMEYGFSILTIFLKHINSSFVFYVMFLSFFTILFFYISFYKLRKKINVGFSILIFTCMFYFQQFNLMRIYLVSSILLLAFIYLINGKETKFLLLLLISFSIHHAALFVLLAYIVYKLLYNKKAKVNMHNVYCKFLILFTFSFLFIAFLKYLIPLFNNINLPFFTKVSKYYTEDIKFRIGFGLLFNMIPYLFIFSFFDKQYLSNKLKTIILSYFLITVIINLLDYSIPVIGRGTICLNAPLLLVVPYLFKKIQLRKKYVSLNLYFLKLKSNVSILSTLILSYFVLYFLIYLNNYVILDGISAFKFVWN